MSTIAALLPLLGDTGIKPWSEGMQSVYQAQNTQTQGQTALLNLLEQKRQQEAMARYEQFAREHPESILGNLQQAPGGPPGMPPTPGMTQQAFAPGMPPGAPVGVPGGQDLSRFAGVSPQGGGPMPQSIISQITPQVTPPPQSVIGGLQGQAPPQAPPSQQSQLMDLMRQDPRAAMLVQQQQQAQQDRQWKLEEQRLDRGVKISESIARALSVVKDQDTLEQARGWLQQISPQAASRLPQLYNKDAIESLQQQGMAMADRALWEKNMTAAQKTREETRLLPELFKDASTGGGGTQETPPQAPATGTRQPVAAASPAVDSAVTDASRLYPQVKPERIKSIIAAESNFDPNAKSSAGAEGLMQLMPATQKDMGVTNAFDVTQNVRGGTRFYAQLLTRYGGDERKALAAYNWGPENLDKVGGDVSKAPASTQAYVNKVLGGGGAMPASGAPPVHPHIAQIDAQIAEANVKAKRASLLGNESLSTRYHDDVQRLTAERNRLEERSTEIPRAVERQTALQPGVLAQQRAGAEVSLEAEMNKPIGAENAVKMGLDAQTKWKDVPKGTQVLERTPEGAGAKFGEYKASYDGITRVIGMLDNPKASSIVGSLFSGDDAAFRRLAGEWISSVTPAERKFAAAMVAEIASIRHGLVGSAVNPEEAAFVKDMMPKTSDPDVGTVRAKLEALQEWVARKHEGLRDQLAQTSVRTPKALAPVPAPASTASPAPAAPAPSPATKPIGEMTLEEARAERARIRARGGS